MGQPEKQGSQALPVTFSDLGRPVLAKVFSFSTCKISIVPLGVRVKEDGVLKSVLVASTDRETNTPKCTGL